MNLNIVEIWFRNGLKKCFILSEENAKKMVDDGYLTTGPLAEVQHYGGYFIVSVDDIVFLERRKQEQSGAKRKKNGTKAKS